MEGIEKMLKSMCVLTLLAASSVAAYADCKHNYRHCDEIALYVCTNPDLGQQDFVGGSDLGYADDIALDKARDAGYRTRECRKRI